MGETEVAADRASRKKTKKELMETMTSHGPSFQTDAFWVKSS